mgnify:CR=1 FL=1
MISVSSIFAQTVLFFEKHRLWISLLFVGVVAMLFRAPYMLARTAAFSFDHGKDSIAVMHMLETGSPKFIGPWTSIPGLFFGPGWYYLLSPAYLLTGGDPMGFANTMAVLMILCALGVTAVFGVLPGIMVAAGTTFLILSQSAWNPFPVPIVMFGLLAMLHQIYKHPASTLQIVQYGVAGALVGLLFHFSSAFAIFVLISMPIVFLIRKRLKPFIHPLAFGIGVGLMFLPQLVFEVRHDFLQTRAVYSYLTERIEGEPRRALGEIIQISVGEITLGTLPRLDSLHLGETIPLGFSTLLALVWVVVLISTIRSKAILRYAFWPELLTIVFTSMLGFYMIHFNFWYMLGLLPLFILLDAHLVKSAHRGLVVIYIAMFLLTGMNKFLADLDLSDRPLIDAARYPVELLQASAQYNHQLLPIKIEVLNEIERRADGRPYASYHYVPDIYDFSYNYLYLWRAKQGKTLPVDFSYKPNETIYIPEKVEILERLSSNLTPVTEKKPERLFFVVEAADNPEYLEAWWNAQPDAEIIDIATFGALLQLYEAVPLEAKSWEAVPAEAVSSDEKERNP